MKKITNIIFLLLLIKVFPQSKKNTFVRVEYDIFYNTELPNTKKGILEIDLNLNNSVFFLSESSLESGLKKDDDKITLIGKNDNRYMKTDRAKNLIQYSEFIKNETYQVNDSIFELNWDINHTEIKKIGEIVCNKATLYFRGRNYIAWYDIKNPINFGPWKFNNLPGLILEIYDETNRYNWKASTIVFSNKSEITIPKEEDIQAISIQEFVDLRYSQNNSKIYSKMPRGVQTEIIDVGRSGIEIKFEWEE